jgi:hypothetical protein
MKGVVFTEFLTMVEETHSLAMVEGIVERANLKSGGVYTSVGTYPVEEMVSLLQELSHATSQSIPDLLKSFGRYLIRRFVAAYPGFFSSQTSCFDFLKGVDSYIHVEVRKLYPDAALPSFHYKDVGSSTLEMEYRSPRGLADLAEGLMLGAAEHFHEAIALKREDLSDGRGTHVRFTLNRLGSAS